MALSLQECADSIVTRLFTVSYGAKNEQTGDRIAIKVMRDAGEADLGGYCRDAAEKAVLDELRAWLQGMDDHEP